MDTVWFGSWGLAVNVGFVFSGFSVRGVVIASCSVDHRGGGTVMRLPRRLRGVTWEERAIV